MGASLRVYRRRIRSVQATKKITKAMELIAASRILKAQARVQASLPYARALLEAVGTVAATSRAEHPLTSSARLQERAAMLLVTSDRGLAGAYSSNAIREGEALTELLRSEGKEVRPFLVGRKAVGFYRFRGREIDHEWTGISESPQYQHAREIADALLEAFLAKTEEGGCDEIHVVYTHFVSMVTQQARVLRILPLEIVDEEGDSNGDGDADRERSRQNGDVRPLYDFEPSPEGVLDVLLPKYVAHLVYTALLESAASEQAARRRAMKSASDNAEDLIKSLSRAANQARQAEITQEISEIVGGADALASATAGSE